MATQRKKTEKKPLPLKEAGLVLVTRKAHFNAAHRLHNPARSDAWNTETYGPCNNPRWHGHNYVIEVTVAAPVDPATGYVMDLRDLCALIEKRIVAPCDHRNLNEEVEFLQGVNPSSENLVIAFWRQLEPELGDTLYAIKLYETERNFVEYRGPKGNL
jgi:6-pyruvoyltetrahydropterin/6-carboxytetrahydropterin synthase